MRTTRVILCWLLAIVWLVLPVHCHLEVIAATALISCESSSDCEFPHEPSCENDFCDSLESAQYFPSQPLVLKAFMPPVSLLLSDLCAPVRLIPVLARTAPPALELSRGWQFSHRAALPVRAPSVRS